MLGLGVIEESNSSWSSPVTLVQKGPKNRLCLDARKVNSRTIKDAYPLPSLTQEMRRAFSTTGSDLMKVKELMERKQGQHETFSDYVSDMHNLHFKLKHKIAEDEFVELLKDNMNCQMGGLLLTSPITSLAELKREGLRVDRWLRNTGRNMRSRAAINEIEEFQALRG